MSATAEPNTTPASPGRAQRRKLGVGVIDTQSAEIETVETVRERIRASLTALPADRLWLSPDCGLRLLDPDVAKSKLATLVTAVKDVRGEI